MKTILQRIMSPLRGRGRMAGIVQISAFILIAVASLWTLVTIVSRVRAESRNTSVDVCLDLNEVISYCQLNKYPVTDFMQRCRAIGVSSLVLGEETVAGLTAGGKVMYFPAADHARLRLLDLVPAGSLIGANSLVTADKAQAESIIRQLELRYGIGVTVRNAGRYQVLAPVFASSFIPPFWGENLWMGFDPDKIDFASTQGFRIYLRPENLGSPAWLDTVPGMSGVVWEGKEVPGYPAKTGDTVHWLKGNGLKLVSLEFVSTNGMDGLRNALPGQLVLGHVIPVPELNRTLDSSK